MIIAVRDVYLNYLKEPLDHPRTNLFERSFVAVEIW